MDVVIVCEHGDVEFYASPESAASDLEAVDLLNDEYLIFDEQGNKLSAKVGENQSITISRLVDCDNCAEELRKMLLDFRTTVEARQLPSDTLLDDLVSWGRNFFYLNERRRERRRGSGLDN